MNQIQFRRKVLDTVAKPEASTNAGLWLDKYLEGNDVEAKGKLVKQVFDEIKISEAYKKFYQKWEGALSSLGIEHKKAETLGRQAVNLGAEATLENSIALNRTYGVPYIPGSALKGLAANFARNSLEGWDKNTQVYKDIFGEQENAGFVNFYDALIDPKSGLGLVPDVVTVHHQEYYQTEGVPPADWDSPIPIHFLSADGAFLIALSGPPSLVKAAYDILALALAREGVGAKTSSGYGRMQMDGYDSEGNPIADQKSSAPQEIPAGYERGVVKNFNETRGFGFIQPGRGGSDVFVHVSNLEKGLNGLKPKQKVIFRRGPARKPGDEQAFDVRLER